jgi:tetratricopeptide (TPR) repeat protein
LWQAALRRRADQLETQRLLAEELWSNGRPLAAADVLHRFVQEHPTDLHAVLRLAELELEIGRTQAASDVMQIAMRLDPDHPDVLRIKAQVEERQGDAEAALATYHRLVQAAPDDLAARLCLADLQLRRGHPDCAAPLLRSVVEHPWVTPAQRTRALTLLGEAYAACQRWEAAADCLSHVIDAPVEPTAEEWYRLAKVQLQCGRLEEAWTSAHRLLDCQPDHSGARRLVEDLQSRQPAEIQPTGFRSEAPGHGEDAPGQSPPETL